MKRVTEEEVIRLYQQYKTPPHVIAHCKAVTNVALHIAEILNEHNYAFDLNLIRGAGLLHDLVRLEDEHWTKGANIIEKLGYSDEANIIRVHMHYYPFHSVDKLTECDLVCLGDRLVKEDSYVGLEERVNYVLNKAPKDPEVVKSILQYKAETKRLLDELEILMGESMDEIFLKNQQEN